MIAIVQLFQASILYIISCLSFCLGMIEFFNYSEFYNLFDEINVLKNLTLNCKHHIWQLDFLGFDI